MTIRERKTLNKPLLRRLARKLRRLRHEEHYNQGKYGIKTACGTAACIAGHAILAEGRKLDFKRLGYHGATYCRRLANETEAPTVRDEARRALGLSLDGAMALFTGTPWREWPEAFAARWTKRAVTNERPSRIAADLLDAIADGTVKL